MNKHEKERFDRLVKRMDWLAFRIHKAEEQGTDLTFDKAELSAIDWGIEIIEKYFALSQSKKDVIGMIGGMRKTENAQEDQSVSDELYYEQQMNIGYNKALDDILLSLKDKEEK